MHTKLSALWLIGPQLKPTLVPSQPMKNQSDDFHRCFSLQGSTAVVCEHANGTYVLGEEDESAPTKKNRLELQTG